MPRPKLSVAEMLARRVSALALVHRGASMSEAARVVGCATSSVARWYAESLDGGKTPAPVQRRTGRTPRLTPESAANLQRQLRDKPKRRHIDSEHWTPELAYAQLSKLSGGYVYAPRVAHVIISRLGFTLRRAANGLPKRWEYVGTL